MKNMTTNDAHEIANSVASVALSGELDIDDARSNPIGIQKHASMPDYATSWLEYPQSPKYDRPVAVSSPQSANCPKFAQMSAKRHTKARAYDARLHDTGIDVRRMLSHTSHRSLLDPQDPGYYGAGVGGREAWMRQNSETEFDGPASLYPPTPTSCGVVDVSYLFQTTLTAQDVNDLVMKSNVMTRASSRFGSVYADGELLKSNLEVEQCLRYSAGPQPEDTYQGANWPAPSPVSWARAESPRTPSIRLSNAYPAPTHLSYLDRIAPQTIPIPEPPTKGKKKENKKKVVANGKVCNKGVGKGEGGGGNGVAAYGNPARVAYNQHIQQPTAFASTVDSHNSGSQASAQSTPKNKNKKNWKTWIKDKDRTTVMLRNIPNKYEQSQLLQVMADKGFDSTKFDFFYLPIDFRNRCCVGYAFINFRNHQYALDFEVAFSGFKLPMTHVSPKICDVNFARIQGRQANLDVYRNSALAGIPIKEYRPLCFDEEGNEIPLPTPDVPLPSVQLRAAKIHRGSKRKREKAKKMGWSMDILTDPRVAVQQKVI